MKYQIIKSFVWVSLIICIVTLTAFHLYAADQKTVEATQDEVISEEIKPEAIKAEQGFCYVGVLTMGRKGDKLDENKKENQSKCILLEDGKPLGLPHSAHKEIREIGKGKYSHWSERLIYFSSSDNSDPRTNGRKYVLVTTKYPRTGDTI